MAWVTDGSPLWHKDTVQTDIKALPSITKQSQLEKEFVNDAIKTSTFHTSRRKPIIPPYNAVKDKYAQAYFHSPIVRAMMERSITIQLSNIMTLEIWRVKTKTKCNQEFNIKQLTQIYGQFLGGQVKDAVLWYQEIKDKQDAGIKINKLSYRRRCKGTPTFDEIRAREQNFVNDAIISEKKRTKYKDIIPVYNASVDKHCLAYFSRPDVQKLISITCTPRLSLRMSKSRSFGLTDVQNKSRDYGMARKSVP